MKLSGHDVKLLFTSSCFGREAVEEGKEVTGVQRPEKCCQGFTVHVTVCPPYTSECPMLGLPQQLSPCLSPAHFVFVCLHSQSQFLLC